VNPFQPPLGTPLAGNYGAGQVPSYLWQSILLTLVCCMPFGIVAIVFASKVDALAAQGDLAGATAASRKAKIWCWVTLASGLIFAVLYMAFIITSAAGTAVEHAP
jgi:hypothetical protein